VFRFWRTGVTAGMVAVLAVTTAVAVPTAASAAPAPGGKPDPAVSAALQRIAGGTSTAADVALISKRPELAKVVDPSRTTVTRTTSPLSRAALDGRTPVGVNGEEICGNWIEITVTAYTVLGFVLFQWKHHAGYCLDLQVGVVSRWEDRYEQMLQADPTIGVLELTVNSASPVPAGAASSVMQRRLQQCILTYGCWANWYPWGEAVAYGNGQWGWRGGA
jgi:hypothetical protein